MLDYFCRVVTREKDDNTNAKKMYGKNTLGLYQDDELACFEYIRGPQVERIRKAFIKIFKEDYNLSITCKTHLKAANFLYINLNLAIGRYQAYNKPDHSPLYTNHPRSLI